MGVFNNFPYANFHELNADWIIEQVRKIMDEWAEYKTDMDLWKLGVDDQLAEFQAWFDNLDVQDEVRNVINELIQSGEFIEITGPQIVSATEAWLAAHITPTTPAVDNTLTISGAAADAKVAGDRIGDVTEDIQGLGYAVGVEQALYKEGYIDCSNDTVDINTIVPSPSHGYVYAVIPCQEGDVFFINTFAAATAKAYCFVSANGDRLAYSTTNGADHLTILAPALSAYLVTHVRLAYCDDPYCFKWTANNRLLADYNYLGSEIIPANSDLNTYQTIGCYRVAAQSIVAGLSNCPSANAGRLIVMTLNNVGAYFQIYIDTKGYLFTRSYSSGAWLAWKAHNDAKDSEVAISIPANSDFNSYRTIGSYKIGSQSIVSSMTNCPSAYAGRLNVMDLNAAGATCQIYIDSRGSVFTRAYSSGAWLPWVSYDMYHYYASAVIPNNSDLDTYKTEGTYRISSVASAGTMSHCPSMYGGRLLVLTSNANGSYFQIYADSMGNVYTRGYSSGAWLEWKNATLELSDDTMKMLGVMNTAHNIKQALTYNIKYANGSQPLNLHNYKANTQNVHPKVLYFPNEFSGHKYWMAYTPYPYSSDKFENPCIAYSDDGFVWTNIAGNPIDDSQGNGYFSDTHLVYNSGTLECWYRYVGPEGQSPREETIYRKTSSDGVTWSAAELIYSNISGSYTKLLSPAVLINDSKYCIWVVNSADQTVDYYEAPVSDVTNWTKIRSITFSINDSGVTVKPWHLDVILESGTYIMLLMCRNGTSTTNNRCSLFITTSEDNITYTTPDKVVEGSKLAWDRFMYRASIVKIGSTYRIYYSAGTGGKTNIYSWSIWGIGITESSSLDDFIGY